MPELLPMDTNRIAKVPNTQDSLYEGVWSEIRE